MLWAKNQEISNDKPWQHARPNVWMWRAGQRVKKPAIVELSSATDLSFEWQLCPQSKAGLIKDLAKLNGIFDPLDIKAILLGRNPLLASPEHYGHFLFNLDRYFGSIKAMVLSYFPKAIIIAPPPPKVDSDFGISFYKYLPVLEICHAIAVNHEDAVQLEQSLIGVPQNSSIFVLRRTSLQPIIRKVNLYGCEY